MLINIELTNTVMIVKVTYMDTVSTHHPLLNALRLLLSGTLAIAALVLAIQRGHTDAWLVFLAFSWFLLGDFTLPAAYKRIPSQRRFLSRAVCNAVGCICLFAVFDRYSGMNAHIWNLGFFIMLVIAALITVWIYVKWIARAQPVLWRFALLDSLLVAFALAGAVGLLFAGHASGYLALCGMLLFAFKEFLFNRAVLSQRTMNLQDMTILLLTGAFGVCILVSGSISFLTIP